MSVANFSEKRDTASKRDKDLLDVLTDMHSDMKMALDISPGVCPDENPEKNALLQYERTCAAAIQRLKELSPYLK